MENILRFFAYCLLFSLLSPIGLRAQTPPTWSAADIYQGIEELDFLGSALYIAAHPDDENTRMIAYLSNALNARTAYLSLTRGDGGQNLIGPEIRELLGVIRTQELLAARRIDGGNQFFTRANDFGYSKHPDETLAIWDKDEVLADVVWTIRRWRPDIIINRFDHERAGETHGHHTTSAILSYEAFDLAGDPGVYPEQLEYVEPWNPRRLFYNTSWWRYGSREAFEEVDKSDMIAIDIGPYYSALGTSNTEMAARSRSMHKSQGFGSGLSRGSEEEYLQLLKGDMPQSPDPFSGINTSWTRVEGGAPIGRLLETVKEAFDFRNPAASVPDLIRVRSMIEALPEGFWKRIKLEEAETLIAACMGLYVEAAASTYSVTPGDSLDLALELVNRSNADITVESIDFGALGFDTIMQQALPFNEPIEFSRSFRVPEEMAYTGPYWLRQPGSMGMYAVEEQQLRGLPETPSPLKVGFHLRVDGQVFDLQRPVVFKRTDRVKGEVYRPLEIIPPVLVNLPDKVHVFANGAPRDIEVVVQAGKGHVSGTLQLRSPAGWRPEPSEYPFTLEERGSAQTFVFTLYPPAEQSDGDIRAMARLDGREYSLEQTIIDYDHIPVQTVLQENRARVVKVELDKAGERVGYIAGAGDAIPTSLEQIGYEVVDLDPDDVVADKLAPFDAVILGIRAYNTQPWLRFQQEELLRYVREGGTLIVQYNTNRGLVLPESEIAPFALELSRDRVTVEEAPVTLLQPDHPVLNFPNRIGPADFEGWVQERGLYFPDAWDEDHFTALLSSHDPGEEPMEGSLLVAPYGQGTYIYTGLSFFRELPAGVPGAFRLFANLISAGKREGP